MLFSLIFLKDPSVYSSIIHEGLLLAKPRVPMIIN